MRIRIAVENNVEGGSIAWLLDYPGCTAAGREESEAVLRVPAALVGFQNWLDKHTEESWLSGLGDFDVRLVQVLNSSGGKKGPLDFFEDDRQPLTPLEVERGLQTLAWLRGDLLDMLTSFTPQELEQRCAGEPRSMREIAEHLAATEFRCLERMGLSGGPPSELPAGVFERLAVVREMLNAALSGLAGDGGVREDQGELWSARKLLRRAVWNERSQTGHIVKLMTLF